jgi:hypothetical protein
VLMLLPAHVSSQEAITNGTIGTAVTAWVTGPTTAMATQGKRVVTQRSAPSYQNVAPWPSPTSAPRDVDFPLTLADGSELSDAIVDREAVSAAEHEATFVRHARRFRSLRRTILRVSPLPPGPRTPPPSPTHVDTFPCIRHPSGPTTYMCSDDVSFFDCSQAGRKLRLGWVRLGLRLQWLPRKHISRQHCRLRNLGGQPILLR